MKSIPLRTAEKIYKASLTAFSLAIVSGLQITIYPTFRDNPYASTQEVVNYHNAIKTHHNLERIDNNIDNGFPYQTESLKTKLEDLAIKESINKINQTIDNMTEEENVKRYEDYNERTANLSNVGVFTSFLGLEGALTVSFMGLLYSAYDATTSRPYTKSKDKPIDLS